MRVLNLLLCCIILFMLGCDNDSDQQTVFPKKPEKRLQIGIVPRAMTPPWLALQRAAIKTAGLMEISLRWETPSRESDGGAQLRAIDALLSQPLDAFAISPADPQRMLTGLERASKKAPLILFQSPDDLDFARAFVYSSATRIGQIGAEQLAQAVGGRGNVAMIRIADPLAVQYECEEAFKVSILGKSGLELVAEPAIADDPAAIDQAVQKLVAGSQRLAGIFATNERATLAVLGAIKRTDWEGQIKVVGIGYDPRLVAGIDRGSVSALMIEDMPKIGDLIVRLSISAARGQNMERLNAIEPLILTAKTRNDPYIRSILESNP